MHFSGSVHSTRSAASTFKSGVTDTKSLDGNDDDGAGAGGGPVLGRRRQLDAVRNRVTSASHLILEYYAETTGRRLADVLEVRYQRTILTTGGGRFGQGHSADNTGRGRKNALRMWSIRPHGHAVLLTCNLEGAEGDTLRAVWYDVD